MPNRILHERICVSETIAQLTAEEERFFYRLMVQCDDYGRFDGRASVLRARCFPLQLDAITEEDVDRWLMRLEEVGLAVTYAVDGRAFLRYRTWERYQQTRAKRSKFPSPGDGSIVPDGTRYQAPSDVPENREPVNENREPRSDIRESLSDSTPQPPPQAEGEHPPTPRKRGAGKPRGERANGVARHDEPTMDEVTPATPGDREAWNLALDSIRGTVNVGNFEQVEQLVPIGRASDGGLHLRAPPGAAGHLQRFRGRLAVALLDAGDTAGPRVAIVEG